MRKKNLYSVFMTMAIFLIAGCDSPKSYKYHTFVYAFNTQNLSEQCCVVVCGQHDDDVIWVELPSNFYEAASALEVDSCCYWNVATDDKLRNPDSFHNFYPTGDTSEDYRLFTNDTGFIIGLNGKADDVYFANSHTRAPLHIPLQFRVIQYER